MSIEPRRRSQGVPRRWILALAAALSWPALATITNAAAPPAASPAPSAAIDRNGSWEAFAPPGRIDAAVYDPVRQRAIVIGWAGPSTTADVWAIGLRAKPLPSWTRILAAGTRPIDQTGASVTYDPVRDRLIVFGGRVTSDLWVLSLADPPTWTRLVVSGTSPAGRSDHAAIYDPVRDRLVIFGGTDDLETVAPLADTWALSLSDGTWSRLAAGGASPPPTTGATAAYDSARDRMLVFGVNGNETWALALAGGGAWSRIDPTGPSPIPQGRPLTLYDPRLDRLLVYTRYHLWTLALDGAPAWSELPIEGAFPLFPQFASAIYDPVALQAVMIGTRTTGSVSLSSESVWTPYAAMPRLSGAVRQAAIYDPIRQRMVVVGDDDWTWALALDGAPSWTPIAYQADLRREGHALIYDARRDRVVLFSGTVNRNSTNDVWVLPLDGKSPWSRLAIAGALPPARAGAAAIYDPVGDAMVVYGGYYFNPRNAYDDTWTLWFADPPLWTRSAGIGTPLGRLRHAPVYDPRRHRMLFFGGSMRVELESNATYALSLSGARTWAVLNDGYIDAPHARQGCSMIYDPVLDRLLLFGGGYEGILGGYLAQLALGDVFELDLAGSPNHGVWSERVPAAGWPSPRYGAATIYDPDRGRMVMFSGDGWPDVWALNGEPGPRPAFTCSGDAEWTPGDSMRFVYSFGNPQSFDQEYVWKVTSARDWPGFPYTGTGTLPALGSTSLPLAIDVPDSAAGGLDSLEFSMTLLRLPQSVRCRATIRVRSVMVAVAAASADTDRVRLAWQAEEASVQTATVYRRSGDEDWRALATITSDQAGRLQYEDGDVTPGTRYDYRIGIVRLDREFFSGETSIDVPPSFVPPPPEAPRLALAGLRPNPARGEFALAFTLAGDSPARLEVIDVNGRRLVDREVGALGAGPHSLDSPELASLRPGLYLIRLTQGGRALVRRGVVVR